MNHELFMRPALALAYSQLGNVSPNPSVGAVIVRDGKIIAEGVTQPPGGSHAELEALRGAGEKARGATLYVTLEPCCHADKRTPPCVDAIIKAGVRRVVIGTRDRNPAVNGKGIAALKRAGIDAVEGVLEAEAKKAHEFFFHWIATKRPFVTVKAAMTLDGKMSWGDGKHKKISGEEAQRLAHLMRRQHDAVLVGIGTVLKDDPQLTCRLVKGRNPLRVVLDSRLRIPPGARLLNEEGKTIVFCTGAHDREKRMKLEKRCEVIAVAAGRKGVEPGAVLEELGKLGITSVLVEGGAAVIASFLNGRLVRKFVFFIAPFPRQDGKGFFELLDGKVLMPKELTASPAGEDVLVEGYP